MTSLKLKLLSVVAKAFAGAIGVARAVSCRAKDAVDHVWQKPAPTDRRSPCPMVNALANHGYLPRDGKGVSLARLITAFKDAINLAPAATLLVGFKSLQASTTRNPLTFNLDDLSKHGVIEHDGSLSRNDIHLGDNHSFAPEVWAAVAAHFADDDVISIETAARARKARLAAAPKMNPAFSITDEQLGFSSIETSLYLLVFGHGTEGDARTEWVRTLFEKERLPFDEGFKRPDKPLKVVDVLDLQKKVEEAA
ncbi:Chloroperoxidase [Lasiosphaeria miniovina]|uniref:Chloroperoxidase n=1 Tax=Lasiosphaeria miniovina TaxID=1954250 RepID=A0AA40E5F0_9PEZI|nr:Chloroperoxidase [Lasiosphaeria miniovina]KAK0727805.1 Chloroperoxidase [Lasiosphaeria miniovina]